MQSSVRDDDSSGQSSSKWLRDLVNVCNIALPTAIGNGLEYLPVLIGIGMVGHSETAQADLEALGLARTFFNIVAAAPGFGLISALRTLCPQAVGAGQPRLCALYLQRALLLVVAWGLVVVVCALYTDKILILVGQPVLASQAARPYVLRMIPTYFGVVGMSAIQRVYQAHNANYANLLIVVCVFGTAPALQWLFIKHLNWGVLGAAWASSCYNNVYFMLQVPHLMYVGRGYLFVPRAASLSRRGMYEYCRLMVPGFLMCCIEWWVLEALVFLAGRLREPNVTIPSFVITGQVQSLGLMAWIGLAVAASSLVGQRIGAGDVEGAKRAAILTPLVGSALGAAVSTGVAFGAPHIAAAFAQDPAIDQLTARLLLLVACVMVLDALSNAMGGVCSGLGLQRYAMLANVLGYYLLGIPTAACVAFVVLRGAADGVYGLWGGVAIAMFASALVQCVLIGRHDWRQSADEARRRLALDGAEATNTDDALPGSDVPVLPSHEPPHIGVHAAPDHGLTNSERARKPLLEPA